MALAIAVEALIVWVVLSFAGVAPPLPKPPVELSVFGVTPEPSTEEVQDAAFPEPQPSAEDPAPAERPEAIAAETQPAPPVPPSAAEPPPPLPFIQVTPETLRRADIARPDASPAAPAPAPRRRPMAGPVDTGPPAGGAWADTPRIAGTGPNGEPLYAASWYREPTRDELRGYLSTATPGFALINCRTVRGYRVEDCYLVDETPGSYIGRAMLAAAWQLRVRPPRLGGQERFGEWVRIRFDYTVTGR